MAAEINGPPLAVGDTLPFFHVGSENYTESATLILILKIPDSRPALEALLTDVLKHHPHASFITGRNLLDIPAVATRVDPNMYYVFER